MQRASLVKPDPSHGVKVPSVVSLHLPTTLLTEFVQVQKLDLQQHQQALQQLQLMQQHQQQLAVRIVGSLMVGIF
jgi:hypothetical protein